MAALRIFTRSCFPAILQGSVAVHSVKCTTPTITEIQKRWSTYKSSPVYKDPSHYTDYDVSKDPVEWSYVERLMRYKTIPKPPSTDKTLPSGWKPATAKLEDHPYFVQRTKNHMKPVYLERSFRGMRRVTYIRKIQGDIWKFEEELKKYVEEKVGKRIGSRVNELIGEVRFRGDFVSHVKRWLDSKGF
ncbi:hypothetical protein KPH14_001225 [Odynerus spinipes]|uniref:Large ribosomal subunit protein mL49 n=1 Tax=Odynerus spinipes TaxID=1348599 RepID=A0AAD9RIE5_9HYME|nr:hypothetical protein KPH14_001225 [Odynerus spinipes]